jgi:uncharacterized protein YjbI with pentapeptide repeats
VVDCCVVIEAPDVLEELASWPAEPLESRFELEDVLIESDLAGTSAAGGRITGCRLSGVSLAGARLRSLRLVDVVLSDCDLSNADLTGASLNRVRFERCRMTGLVGVSWEASQVVLRGCKLDLASFHRGVFRGVEFEDCVLDDADLAASWLRETRFASSRLVRVGIDDARLSGVDFRGSVLEPAGDLTALRGAVIDALQLVELAPLLARGLGIDVR